MENIKDPVLLKIVETIRTTYKCHTIILYGSRARGSVSQTSDYDVAGVCSRGKKTRITKQQNGFYWDVFVYPEKDLTKLTQQQLSWRGAKLLYAKDGYGKNLLAKIKKLVSQPYKPMPKYELDVLKIWAQKEIDRIRTQDIHGLFRRAELHNAFIEHYFDLRKKRFWGPKAGINWLIENDKKAYKLILNSYKKPSDLKALIAATNYIYKTQIK